MLQTLPTNSRRSKPDSSVRVVTCYPRHRNRGVQPIGISDTREISFDSEALIDVIAGSLERARAIGLPMLKPSGVDFSPQSRQVIFLYRDS
jgi:hypothetical protein